jgi:hypothetical protein
MPDTNCCIAINAISSLDRLSIFSKKELGNALISSGKYKPLSGAIPLTTALSKETSGAVLFKL